MSTLARVVLGLLIGYALGAALGFSAVQAVSDNVHDKDLEAIMTAVFGTGPLGAALGVAVALWRSRKR